MKTKIFSLLLAITTSLGMMYAKEITVGDFVYGTIDNTTVKVRRCARQLTVVNIPSSIEYESNTYSVVKIDGSAFQNDTGIVSTTIPSSVTVIGSYAFDGCTKMQSITIEALTPPTISGNSFSSCPATFYVPCSALSAYMAANNWSKIASQIDVIRDIDPIIMGPYDLGIVIVPICSCDEKVLQAVANYGCHFVQWSDGNKDNPRAFVNTSDITYTPEFVADRIIVMGDVNSDTIIVTTVYDDITANDIINLQEYAFSGASITVLSFHVVHWGWEAEITVTKGDEISHHMIHILKYIHYSVVRATITGENKETKASNFELSGNGRLYNDAHISAYNQALSITDSLGYTGYKLGKNGQHLAILLNNESFAKGDILNIYTTQNTNFDQYYAETDSCLHVYANAGGTPVAKIKEHEKPGLHSVVLGEAIDGKKAVYLYRTKNDMNPYVAYMEVIRTLQYEYNVKCDPQAGYAVRPNGYTDYLGKTTIEVVPNYGYHFTQWSDGITDNPRQVELFSDTTFMAEFARNEYTITTVSATPQWGFTAGDTTALYLDSVTISAKPNYGYHFAGWTDEIDGIEPTEPIEVFPVISVSEAYNIASGLKNGERTTTKYTVAGFIVGEFTSAARSYYMADSPSEDGQFVIYRVNSTANVGDFVYVTAWLYNYNGIYETYSGGELSYIGPESHDPEIPVYADTATLRCVQVVSDTTYTAIFAKNLYKISKQSDSVMGYIKGLIFAEYLDTVEISAVSNHGYHFVQWSDGVTDNPRTFVLTQDTTFTAVFAQTFSGQCGNELYWSFNGDTLTFTGSGNMFKYGQDDLPWSLFASQTKYIDFSLAMTSISPFAFGEMVELRKVNLPSTLTVIGENAFADCTAMKTLTIPNSVGQLGSQAFYGCSGLDTLVVGSGITAITNQFRSCSGLRFLQLSQNIQSIDYGAFFEARQLTYIVCYAKQPPLAYPDEGELLRSFYNTHAAVLIPCDNFDTYKHDALWGSFDLQCQSSSEASASTSEVTVVPGDADATFTWPTEASADTYTLEITKNGEVFCTLTFNSQGQLLGIAFAPSRNGNIHHAHQAVLNSNGMSFQVTGLDYASQYRFSFETKNADAQTLFAYMGAFNTNGADAPQGIEDIRTNDTECTKYLINGQIFILRGEKTYTITGQEVK